MDPQKPKIEEKKPNRLIKEKSPYLLQHAYNPVDWYPWGEEAFEKAKKEDKPIFLSIGYSTCHWCHVMEKESFEDPEVARLMNETFVNIKVDREERPDIDSIYMSVAIMVNGSGGWPLTIIMTPDKRPFFVATYIPKRGRFGRIGMMELIPQIKELWQYQRDKIEETARNILYNLKYQRVTDENAAQLDESLLKKAYSSIKSSFDSKYGGFSRPPKFPMPHIMLFLLRYWNRTKEPQALQMVEKTLLQMRLGGVYDHIGFGFHRYSTDEKWLLPHFEKMLYDQALLLMAYTEAYLATKNDFYKKTAEEIITYVLRDMTSPQGAFYSAEDADSEGEEGKFYVWTVDELKTILSAEETQFAIKIFNVKTDGNYHDEATGKKTKKNILHLTKDYDTLAKELKISTTELQQKLEQIREKLFTAREKRVHPLKDDKILTDWNGLMIAALAKAGRAFDKKEYVNAAAKATEFFLQNMVTKNGRLYHRYRNNEAAVLGFLDDYAFLSWGLIELYHATFDPKYLKWATKFVNLTLEHFWDAEHGGFYFTSLEHEKLLTRKKEAYDGAIPSGNSVNMLNLLTLARLTGKSEYEEYAQKIAQINVDVILRAPMAFTGILIALDFAFGPTYEVVIVGEKKDNSTKKILQELYSRYLPNVVILLKPISDDKTKEQLEQIVTFVRPYQSLEGKTTVYVCKNFNCELPTTSPRKMLELLQISA